MSAGTQAELSQWLTQTKAWADRALVAFLPVGEAHPARLYGAMRHPFMGGGKRLRPALVRLVALQLGGSDQAAERPAAAIELVHSYSLVHDDLPCMDDDDLRRGRPTVHVAYDEATAVLAGDALLTLAFEVLAGAKAGAALVGVLARDAGAAGMVGGQVLDLSLELSAETNLEAVLDMHRRKTSALFAAAAEMGAIAAGANLETRNAARGFGLSLGSAFQAVDDLLDVTGDAQTLGKTPGKDAALDRASLVAAVGFERASEIAEELVQEAYGALARLGWPAEGLAGQLLEFVLKRRT